MAVGRPRSQYQAGPEINAMVGVMVAVGVGDGVDGTTSVRVGCGASVGRAVAVAAGVAADAAGVVVSAEGAGPREQAQIAIARHIARAIGSHDS